MTTAAPETTELVWPDMSDLLPCEWWKADPDAPQCDSSAEWVAWRACCMDKAKFALYCTGHKDEVLATEDGVVCQFCEAPFIPARKMYMHFEPLNARPEE